MAVVTMKQLLEAGVQFGHQTRRWNPKMKRFIHGDKAGIHIVDLRQTLAHLERAYVFVRDLVANGGTVLFIGTKKQAQDSVQSFAERCNMPYVNERWQGGMLTNFHTIAKRIAKMKQYQRMRDSGEFEAMPKKEALLLDRELTKLERNLGGIRDMEEPPGAVFILDTKKEYIAVTEARKLGVPIVAVVDTNCDPDLVDYAIPGNDDAIRSGRLMARVISDAVLEGRFIHSKRTEATTTARDALTEAEVAEQQALARAEAAAEAAEREARVAKAKAEAAAAEDAQDEGSEAVADDAGSESQAAAAAEDAGSESQAAASAEDAGSESQAAAAAEDAGSESQAAAAAEDAGSESQAAAAAEDAEAGAGDAAAEDAEAGAGDAVAEDAEAGGADAVAEDAEAGAGDAADGVDESDEEN
ncbi:MAG: 30S ribosomal protein S2 [Acidimicrobiaceae bacterium]|nr:30S ribosomal protein S2 [Acidimicrobiaceae bacterium]MYI55138.1 30S ribosomal protein S2 [Acidimicrobiaceae bacterium]